MKKFKILEPLVDRVSGLEGTAIKYIKYLNGCEQYVLARKVKDNEYPKDDARVNVDAGQLESADENFEGEEFLAELDFTLGNLLEDKASGFRGISILYYIDADKGVNWGLKPEMKEGSDKIPDAQYFNQSLLQKLDDGLALKESEDMETEEKEGPGGDMPDVPRMHDSIV
jgi:hypothetical protein